MLNESKVAATAIVDPDVVIDGRSVVDRNALVLNQCEVHDYATVTDAARLINRAIARGGAYVGGNSTVGGNSVVQGNGKVIQNAYVGGNTIVQGRAVVGGDAKVTGDSLIGGTARLLGPIEVQDGHIHGPGDSAWSARHGVVVSMHRTEKGWAIRVRGYEVFASTANDCAIAALRTIANPDVSRTLGYPRGVDHRLITQTLVENVLGFVLRPRKPKRSR